METHLSHDVSEGVWRIWTNVPATLGWIRKLECATPDPDDHRAFTIPDAHVRSIRYLLKPTDRPGYKPSTYNPYSE